MVVRVFVFFTVLFSFVLGFCFYLVMGFFLVVEGECRGNVGRG